MSQMCPEWRGMAECPTKEAALYEQYAHEHPQSPKAAEALYNAAWRQAALTDIYRINNDRDKSEAARKKGVALAQQIQSQQQDPGLEDASDRSDLQAGKENPDLWRGRGGHRRNEMKLRTCALLLAISFFSVDPAGAAKRTRDDHQ